MKIAVTGATGFLGGHIVDRLLADGHTVSILARSADRAAPLSERVEQVTVGDITDAEALDQLMKGADAVIHLVSNFRTTTDSTAQTTRTNLEGTIRALEAAERASSAIWRARSASSRARSASRLTCESSRSFFFKLSSRLET